MTLDARAQDLPGWGIWLRCFWLSALFAMWESGHRLVEGEQTLGMAKILPNDACADKMESGLLLQCFA